MKNQQMDFKTIKKQLMSGNFLDFNNSSVANFDNLNGDDIHVWFSARTSTFCIMFNGKVIKSTKTFNPIKNKLIEWNATLVTEDKTEDETPVTEEESFKDQIIRKLETGEVTPQTPLKKVSCKHCGEVLPDHTIEQHFDGVFMSHFHKCKDEEFRFIQFAERLIDGETLKFVDSKNEIIRVEWSALGDKGNSFYLTTDDTLVDEFVKDTHLLYSWDEVKVFLTETGAVECLDTSRDKNSDYFRSILERLLDEETLKFVPNYGDDIVRVKLATAYSNSATNGFSYQAMFYITMNDTPIEDATDDHLQTWDKVKDFLIETGSIEWSEDNQHDSDSCPTIADDIDSKYYDFGKPKGQPEREGLMTIILSLQEQIVESLEQVKINYYKYKFESITRSESLETLLSLHSRLVDCKEFQDEREQERRTSESYGFACDVMSEKQMREKADEEFNVWVEVYPFEPKA